MSMSAESNLLDAACTWITAQLRSALEPADGEASIRAQELREAFHALTTDAEPMRLLGRLGLSQTEMAALI